MSQKALAHSIARVAVEVLHDFSVSQGNAITTLWDECTDEHKARALADVEAYLGDELLPASHSHTTWRNARISDGWTYGPVYDAEAKTDPKIVPFTDLPALDKMKASIFRGVVRAIAREQMR